LRIHLREVRDLLIWEVSVLIDLSSFKDPFSDPARSTMLIEDLTLVWGFDRLILKMT